MKEQDRNLEYFDDFLYSFVPFRYFLECFFD